MAKTIRRVRLIDSGLKGVLIHHMQTGIRNGEKYNESHPVTYSAPANAELIAHFDGLKQNFIDLLKLKTDIPLDEVVVSEANISPDGNFFWLAGIVKTDDGDLKMKTRRIDKDSSYVLWGSCMGQVKALFAEAKSYISEKKVMATNQLVMQLFSNEKFASKQEKGFDELSDDEKTKLANDWNAKRGAITIEPFVDPGDEQPEPDEEETEEAEDGGNVAVPDEPVESEESGKVIMMDNTMAEQMKKAKAPFGKVATK